MNDVTAKYEYELLSKKSNSVVQGGIIPESEITLTNLERSDEYTFRVRVVYSNAFKNNARSFSDWRSVINEKPGKQKYHCVVSIHLYMVGASRYLYELDN